MARYRRRRRRTGTRLFVLTLVAAFAAVGVWWTFLRDKPAGDADGRVALGPRPTLTTDRPEVPPEVSPQPDVSEKGDAPHLSKPTDRAESGVMRADALVSAGKEAVERNDLVSARAYLGEALQAGLEDPERSLVRAELTRIGNETILSPRIFDKDPLVSRHIIQLGETLGKIAKANNVSADLLAAINGIANKNRIRAGQTIKVVTGPFHAVVNKQTYTLDVYLGTTFVKHFRVGLGADDSTPTGEWKVGTKLVNPTYYPPRGGTIVSADDPENPLGERWIGMVGFGGEAAGQERYGIHGTVDPDSIGRSVSLGCIRLYNEDVEALFTFLVEKHSTVTVRD